MVRVKLLEYKTENKDEAQNNQGWIQGFIFTGAEFDDYITKDSKGDTVSNGIAEHHCYHRYKCRKGFTDFAEINLFHTVKHQDAYQY